MKQPEKIDQFIILKAQGKSLASIAAALQISKSTAFDWSKQHAEAIKDAQRQRAEELQDLYHREQDEHRQRLKDTLQRIDKALEAKDLEEIPPAQLLRLKLEYLDRLKAEPPEMIPASDFVEYNAAELLQALANILEAIQAGTITAEQSRSALATLEALRKGMEYRSDNQLSDSLLKSFL